MTWTQTGSDLKGSIVINGAGCITGGTVSGTLNGSTISFGAVSGQVKIDYTGSVSGSSMSGTYAAGATCANAKGDWKATKG